MKIGALILSVAGLAAATQGAAGCRQALAIGIDVSGSVDTREYALQRDGMVAALDDPDVRFALLQMPEAPVTLAVYEWSGTGSQRIMVPWTDIGDETALQAFQQALAAAPRWRMSTGTAIGDAMQFGRDLLAERADCPTLTLDLAGDGRSNLGPKPPTVPMRAGTTEITVNALAVGLPEGHGGDPGIAELSAYFMSQVIRGPDAFVEIALGYQDFQQAMARKLIKEISVPGFAGGATRKTNRPVPG